MVDAEEHLLEVRNLCTYFHTEEGLGKAVDGVSFELRRGETLGLVGESGCGKSVSALSVMRLIPQPPGQIESGEILFGGQDLLRLSEEEMCRVRGDEIAMIFQEPMTSLNPVLTCGFQIAESVILHQGVSKQEARNRAIEMLRLVGIPAPEQRVDEYPHQLSGGMRQRVMIAMALSCNPQLLIADEPTTALDVTIQAQILELLQRLQEELKMAVLMITHDLGVIAEVADRVAVMYAGQVVEYASTRDLFNSPQHPYTRGLMQSVPRLDESRERLDIISGIVPDAREFPEGCRFAPRCPLAEDRCRSASVELRALSEEHLGRCLKMEG
ncbi:MAG: ABC transporter ATP-binding protein [Candidatus Latescibacterota bacterium]|nr:ABC transporter ATP-binding protein [Candidatus Latescibacterota bacterium]MEE2627083.1 ABC transporter ATP-binding protein [Candidatus Latescibacterota bacterium]MEE2726797.1 ABC transporter ATP-binding protein [Candidatus Latescibacterota bacterium]